MSFSGSYTPLSLNVISSLTSGVGFTINGAATTYQGTWTPAGYTPGTLLSSTLLGPLTVKIGEAYAAAQSSTVSPDVYRTLLTLGSSTCPALGNSRPSTFRPTYPGYGSWTGATLNSDSYPPKGFPTSGTYSYIQQAYGGYAWITGWPGTNSWQETTDTYAAAYLPTTGDPLTDYDEYFSTGFISTVARQAYYEMWSGQFEPTNNIVNSFGQASAYKNNQNTDIASFVNSKTFMSGVYSNINDLTTSDIAGVNQAFKVWGNDLINSGRAIYLPDISTFGLPSSLLRNLYRNNVVTEALKLAMIFNEITPTELNNIFLNNAYVPAKDLERKIYNSFLLISGNDLHSDSNGIMYGLNCKTTGIETLADLLNPLKLFPNSYNSLTVPQYSTTTVSAKIYDFIYIDGGVNSRIQNWGDYLEGILEESLAISCGAFSMSMQQIKFISNMDIQKFSQVVTNLELVNLGLPLINTDSGIPVNINTVDQMLANIALGSGNSGSYRQCDFFGAASGYPYTGYYEKIIDLIGQLTTPTLETIYSTYPVTTDGEIITFVAAANTEIASIYAANPELVDQLNYYWNLIGNQLAIEQQAIPLCVPIATSVPELSNSNEIPGFVRQVEEWSLNTTAGGEALTLEGISDTTILGGQSLIAMMREARNASRLALAGGDLQNNVDTYIDTCCASATATVVDGTITEVQVTSGSSGYTAAKPPVITVYPVGHGALLNPILATDGSISAIEVISGGSGYSSATLEITLPPQCQPVNPPQQTYTDTPDSQLVPPELISPPSASPTVAEAIVEVVHCNCDCWN